MANNERENRRRLLVAVGVFVVLIAAGAFAFKSCQSEVAAPPASPAASSGEQSGTPPAAAAPEAKRTTTTKAAGFVGTWTGKWDGIYSVQFTISQDPQDRQYQVVYEWEETLGQPMKRREWPVTEQAGTLVTGPIEITLSTDDPDHAIAVGHFRKPRTAELTRQ